MLVDGEKWGLDLGQRTKLALDFRITSVEVTDEDRGKGSRWGFTIRRGFRAGLLPALGVCLAAGLQAVRRPETEPGPSLPVPLLRLGTS